VFTVKSAKELLILPKIKSIPPTVKIICVSEKVVFSSGKYWNTESFEVNTAQQLEGNNEIT